MDSAAIRQLQKQLGVALTGVIDMATLNGLESSLKKALAANKDVQKYAGVNSVDAIQNAYMTNNWSGVIDLTGKPFTKVQQAEAVKEAEKALAPAYKAQETYDLARTEDALRSDIEGYDNFLKTEAEDFKDTKDSLDDSAASQGILFSGARKERERDLRNTYTDRAALERAKVADRLNSTNRSYQYTYGNEGVQKLGDYFNMGQTPTYNASVARGAVTPNKTLSAVYDPTKYKFQGTAPVAQKAAVQTRAAGLLANKANKLTSTGYKNQF